MEKRAAFILVAFALACDPMPLTSDRLRGIRDAAPSEPVATATPDLAPERPPPGPDGGAADTPADSAATPDAGSPDVTKDLASQDMRAPADTTTDSTPTGPHCPPVESPPPAPNPPPCNPNDRSGMLSGMILDDCDGSIIGANVGLGGVHGCSNDQKGSFNFNQQPVGCALTLTAAKHGYEPYCRTVTIAPPGNPGVLIRLQRVGGCTVAKPAESTCRCTGNCVPL